ncbi:MAG TPA: sigma-70 family RNA polymerase sigma factor [Terriglobales bacterium]|nr:sigma-70 family RNA polymerase sigma factor [Terriglobales bacterium]
MTEHQQKSEEGSGEVLERLLAHRDDFLRFLEKRVESRVVAEDILQSAFVRGIAKASTVRDEESAVAWFYRLLRNAVIDHYRSRESTTRTFEAWPEGLDVPGQPVEFVKNEICRCVEKVLADLKPEYREALRTVDIDEHPVTEYAEHRGISPNNANVRVHRARAALRKQVQMVCGSCAEHRCVDCTCKHPQ